MRNSGVNIEQMNITLPPKYLEKGVAEIIEGQVREIGYPLVLTGKSEAE